MVERDGVAGDFVFLRDIEPFGGKSGQEMAKVAAALATEGKERFWIAIGNRGWIGERAIGQSINIALFRGKNMPEDLAGSREPPVTIWASA